MPRTRTRLAAIGVAGVLAAGATVSVLSPALAQEAAETPRADEHPKQERHAERRADYAAALAEELDLPVARVSAAIDTVNEQMRAEAKERRLAELKERLDAAVEAGTLTQEQADAIYAAAESGVLPGGGRHGRGGRGHHRPPAQDTEPAAEPASA